MLTLRMRKLKIRNKQQEVASKWVVKPNFEATSLSFSGNSRF